MIVLRLLSFSDNVKMRNWLRWKIEKVPRCRSRKTGWCHPNWMREWTRWLLRQPSEFIIFLCGVIRVVWLTPKEIRLFAVYFTSMLLFLLMILPRSSLRLLDGILWFNQIYYNFFGGIFYVCGPEKRLKTKQALAQKLEILRSLRASLRPWPIIN